MGKAAKAKQKAVKGLVGVEDEDEEEDTLEEKKKKDLHADLPGDPTWSLEERMQVRDRILESGTGLGFPDLAFDAAPMVQDSFEIAKHASSGIQEMMDIVIQAARKMRDEDWVRFTELPVVNRHKDDQVVHGNFFAQKEPTWRATLQKPKKTKTTCVFLFIGTEPPSQALGDFLTKLGWLGVVLTPHAPPPGNEDLLQYLKVDPADHQDQRKIDDLMAPKGGLVPKPVHFGLCYVNVTFNPLEEGRVLDPYDDDYAEKLRARREKDRAAQEAKERKEQRHRERAERIRLRRKEEEAAARAGRPVRPASSATQPSEEESSEEDDPWAAKSLFENTPLPEPTPTCVQGFGKIGLTRGERVRRRLRALRNSIAVAVHRLAPDGSLVIFWPGTAVHPALFFLAASLRKLFQRVHVTSPEGSKTFDIYILAIGFKREKAEDRTIGVGGIELKSFLEGPSRRDTLDDILHWTLGPDEEQEEMSVGASGRGIVASYTEMWTNFAEKYRSLAMDLGVLLFQDEESKFNAFVPPSKPKEKAKMPPPEKAKKDEGERKGSEEAVPVIEEKGEEEEDAKEKKDEKPEKQDEKQDEKSVAKQEENRDDKKDGKHDEKKEEKLDEKTKKHEEPKHKQHDGKKHEEHKHKKHNGKNDEKQEHKREDGASSPSKEEKKEEQVEKKEEQTSRPKSAATPNAKAGARGKSKDGQKRRGSNTEGKPGSKEGRPGSKGSKQSKGSRRTSGTANDAEGGHAGEDGEENGEEEEATLIEKKLAELEEQDYTIKKQFVLTRSLPSLACSLGASPGHKNTKGPDYQELADKYRLFGTALEVARIGRMRRWNAKVGGGRSKEITLPPASDSSRRASSNGATESKESRDRARTGSSSASKDSGTASKGYSAQDSRTASRS